MKKLFIDAEFTGLYKETKLISLGIVSEDNQMFYAEFKDFYQAMLKRPRTDNFIENEILPRLKFLNDDTISKNDKYQKIEHNKTLCYGNTLFIKQMLIHWLKRFADENILVVADVGHYDFMLFIDLICEDALLLPKYNIIPAYHDINSDIARYYKIDYYDAFNKDRDKIVNDFRMLEGEYKVEFDKHNSLSDALMTKMIYEYIDYHKSNSNNKKYKINDLLDLLK